MAPAAILTEPVPKPMPEPEISERPSGSAKPDKLPLLNGSQVWTRVQSRRYLDGP